MVDAKTCVAIASALQNKRRKVTAAAVRVMIECGCVVMESGDFH